MYVLHAGLAHRFNLLFLDEYMNKINALFPLLLLFFFISPAWADSTGALSTQAIYFDIYASTPKIDSMKTLEGLKKKISNNKDLFVLIEGHSDDREPQKGDRDVARMRADYVSNWLASALGHSFSHEVKSYGSSRPAVRSNPFAGKPDSKRVEVKLYAKKSSPKEAQGNAPQVYVPEMEFTFNDVIENTIITHGFVIRNVGKSVLDIINVKPG